jgi:hypothetical protein
MSLLLRLIVLADIPDSPPDDGGGSSTVLVVAGVVLLVAAVVGIWLLVRRSRQSS